MSLVYECYLIGGPNDGERLICFRPYYQLVIGDSLYHVTGDCSDPDTYSQWISDDKRRIELYYRGFKELV